MTDAQHYDVIVVGTGAGGGTIAHRLAPTGKRILLLARGDCLPRERDNRYSTAVFVKGKYRAPESWFDKHGNQFPPEVNYYVGGNTPDNRVTLDRDGGIHLTLDEKNNIAGPNHPRHELRGMRGHLGMYEDHLLSRSIYLHKGMPIGATAHQAGTVRFGRDPADSALDVDCKAHDLDNLYVVDPSFFPSIGTVNPSLTAITDALRVGERIADRPR
ncbi:GMC family oxidoreductase [Streptomyces olivochromogenes]|nr:GMC family oxidoreductase [Streptomyces olivochromogenes]KUN44683.1 hypothetical protein AQJ27_25025 [Streptomyces olivochromogenes]